MSRFGLVLLGSLFVLLVPGRASGQVFVGAGVGGVMGGSFDERERTFTLELAGVHPEGWLGAELDFGHVALRPTGRVRTIVGSVLVAPKVGELWRVFGVAGGGKFFDDAENNPLFAFGGGLLGDLGAHVGLRVEARYFRDTKDRAQPGSTGERFRYTRIIGGLHLKF